MTGTIVDIVSTLSRYLKICCERRRMVMSVHLYSAD